MVRLSVAFVLSALACSISAAPLNKRIAQVIADSTTKWEAACIAAGGAEQCNPVSVTAFSTLLAAAGPCDQQNSGDAMIDLAKTLNNDPDMIKFTQIFVQQPRNSPNSQAIPYCQTAPNNTELNGLFQCQFQGSDQTTFVGGVQVGAAGTIPFGMTSPLNPPGSCPANPSGPIADGTQLVDLVDSAGVPSSSDSNSSAAPSPPAATAAGSCPPAGDTATSVPVTTAATSSVDATPPPAATSAPASGDFHLQNGEDAQALNAKFATLTASSACNAGDQACVNGGFAQCVGGSFVVTQCAAGTQCFALPLVNKAGTSLACTTQDDALSRIQDTGVQGGVDGN